MTNELIKFFEVMNEKVTLKLQQEIDNMINIEPDNKI